MSGYTSHLSELRETCDKHRTSIHAELAKHGVPPDCGNTRAEQLSYRNAVRRVINANAARARELVDKDPFTPEVKAEYDKILDTIDGLGAVVEVTQHFLDLEEEANARLGLPRRGEASWCAHDGRVIRVLAKHERMSDDRYRGRDANFGFGEYVASMVIGTNRPEIRNSLAEGTDSAGGYTVPTHLMTEVIDLMRAKTVVIQAGALTVPLDSKTTKIARLASDPAAAWRAELGNVATSDPTFDAVEFNARSLAVIVKVSRELLEDSININQALTAAFAGAMAVEMDRVALFGSGTTPEPRGVANTTGINSVSMGTNGAALTNYGPLLDAIYEIEADNALPSAWVMHPRTARALNGLADSTGQPLRAPEAVTAYPRLASTNVPISQTQGTAANASSIILGDWSQLLIGVRSEMRIEILRELYAGTHEYGFVCHLRADVAVAHPAAFCKLVGITP